MAIITKRMYRRKRIYEVMFISDAVYQTCVSCLDWKKGKNELF